MYLLASSLCNHGPFKGIASLRMGKHHINKKNRHHPPLVSSVCIFSKDRGFPSFLKEDFLKGRVRLTNRMNFRKSSKRPLTPPPLIFGKLYCAFRDKIVTKVRMLIWRHCCVLYDPISHKMHVVQMFNMVIGWKHTLKRPFYIIFMLKKPCLKVQILQYKFLDWKWPPPFRNFSENSSDLLTWPVPKEGR